MEAAMKIGTIVCIALLLSGTAAWARPFSEDDYDENGSWPLYGEWLETEEDWNNLLRIANLYGSLFSECEIEFHKAEDFLVSGEEDDHRSFWRIVERSLLIKTNGNILVFYFYPSQELHRLPLDQLIQGFKSTNWNQLFSD
jgi:hypothetical protein